LSIQIVITKYHKWDRAGGAIKNRNVFLPVLEKGKSKTKASVDLLTAEGLSS
jgi:hypothetical protein